MFNSRSPKGKTSAWWFTLDVEALQSADLFHSALSLANVGGSRHTQSAALLSASAPFFALAAILVICAGNRSM